MLPPRKCLASAQARVGSFASLHVLQPPMRASLQCEPRCNQMCLLGQGHTNIPHDLRSPLAERSSVCRPPRLPMPFGSEASLLQSVRSSTSHAGLTHAEPSQVPCGRRRRGGLPLLLGPAGRRHAPVRQGAHAGRLNGRDGRAPLLAAGHRRARLHAAGGGLRPPWGFQGVKVLYRRRQTLQ